MRNKTKDTIVIVVSFAIMVIAAAIVQGILRQLKFARGSEFEFLVLSLIGIYLWTKFLQTYEQTKRGRDKN
jgi:hypothetical protein